MAREVKKDIKLTLVMQTIAYFAKSMIAGFSLLTSVQFTKISIWRRKKKLNNCKRGQWTFKRWQDFRVVFTCSLLKLEQMLISKVERQ